MRQKRKTDTDNQHWAQRDPSAPLPLLFVPVCSFDSYWQGTYSVNKAHTVPALRELTVSRWSYSSCTNV